MKWNEFRQLLDQSVRADKNWIKLKAGSRHNFLLARCCAELAWHDMDFLTEVSFKPNKFSTAQGRADIVVPLYDVIIEIVVSETEERLLKKHDYYPESFGIYPVKKEEDIFKILQRIKQYG